MWQILGGKLNKLVPVTSSGLKTTNPEQKTKTALNKVGGNQQESNYNAVRCIMGNVLQSAVSTARF